MIKQIINKYLYYELDFKKHFINIFLSYKYNKKNDNNKILIDTREIDLINVLNNLMIYDKFIKILIDMKYKISLILKVNIKNNFNKDLIINHNINYPYVYNIIGNNNIINDLYLLTSNNMYLYIENVIFKRINNEIYNNKNYRFKRCKINLID